MPADVDSATVITCDEVAVIVAGTLLLVVRFLVIDSFFDGDSMVYQCTKTEKS